MAPPKQERLEVETRNLKRVGPAELLGNNPAALIVNDASYKRIEANFAPNQLDPPQVVRVVTYSSSGTVVIRDLVIDGLTRTKFMADYNGKALSGGKTWNFDQIEVNDVTDSMMNNPEVVRPEEKREGQTALTMLQFLRAVVPPTVVHSEIAPDRIAAHLMNGWENMVGEDISQKFSALAALSVLANQRVPIATDTALRRFLAEQKELIAGETTPERSRIEQALLETAYIIRQAKLFKEQVAQSAFVLVTSGSDVIGGTKEAISQIYGLLHKPAIEKKLTMVSEQLSQKEQMRDQLGRYILDTLSKIPRLDQRQEALQAITDVLDDNRFNLAQVLDVIRAASPTQRYEQVNRGVNRDQLKQAYMSTNKLVDLSAAEEQLIDQLGLVSFLEENEIAPLVRTIKNAAKIVQEATALKERLTVQRNDYLKRGVTAQVIDTALAGIDSIQEELRTTNSLQAVSRKIATLADVVSKAEQTISYQRAAHNVGKIIDELFAKELKGDYAIRASLIDAVLEVTSNLDQLDKKAIRERLQQFRNLDPDLQREVLNGSASINHAIQVQEIRKKAKVRPQTVVPKREVTQVEPRSELQQSTVVYTSPVPPQSGLRRREPSNILEKKRQIENNARLKGAADSLRLLLEMLQLDKNELTLDTRTALDNLMRILGKKYYDHPDIVRVIREEYPKLLQASAKAAEKRIGQQQEEDTKETRTGL